MTLIQALLAAVGALTACVVFLFGIVMTKNKAQDAKLLECEVDRKGLQVQITDMWKQLYLANAIKKPEDKV